MVLFEPCAIAIVAFAFASGQYPAMPVSSSHRDDFVSAVSIASAAVRVHGCVNNVPVVMQEAG